MVMTTACASATDWSLALLSKSGQGGSKERKVSAIVALSRDARKWHVLCWRSRLQSKGRVLSYSLVIVNKLSSESNHDLDDSGAVSNFINDGLPSGFQGPLGAEISEKGSDASTEVDRGQTGGNGGGHDKFNGGSSGGGDGSDSDSDSNVNEDEFGPILNAEEVSRQVQAQGVELPPDMLQAAKVVGMRSLLLSRYLELQGAAWPLGPAIRTYPLLRDRMLADPSFLFKVLTEIMIDAGCATFAEVQKRGKEFWNEFELYASDLLVGIVLDIALVGMLAPFVQFGTKSYGTGRRAQLSQAIQALPSSIFEAARPGRSFSGQQRVGTLFCKAVQYGVVGFACGMVGQGLASSIMTLKRKWRKSEEEEVKVPPILQSAVLWGVFMAVSSNTRYQIINGLERVVESSVLASRVPEAALAFTVGIRFANNIFGGMQFVEWARLSGVQ